MGKRITQQARGKGSLTFRVRPRAYRYKINYPPFNIEGYAKIIKLINSPAHSSPLAKIEVNIDSIDNNKQDRDSKAQFREVNQTNEEQNPKGNKLPINNKKIIFIVPAAEGIYEGKEIYIGRRPENRNYEFGDILRLIDIKQGTKVFNIEVFPGSGGKFLRSAGSFGIIEGKDEKDDKVKIAVRRRKIRLNKNCRAIIGVVAGGGRKLKPIIKAGKQFYRMKAIGRKWHRTSAVKVNAIDHPFGGGRGKRIKSKIAKRNAPPGAKVGHIRPRRTGMRR